MFDIGWTELVVVGVVALIVIGPKDLPEMFRTLGRVTAKARGMAREFQRAMESAADEAGVKDVADDLRKATSARSMGLDAVKAAASKFEAWEPGKPRPAAAGAGAAALASAPTPAAAPDRPADEAAPAASPGPATAALAQDVAARKAQAQAEAQARAEARAPAAEEPVTKDPA